MNKLLMVMDWQTNSWVNEWLGVLNRSKGNEVKNW